MQVIRTTPIEGHYSPYLVVPVILEDINLNFGNTSNFSDFPSLYNKLLEGRIHIISSGSDSSGINFDNAFQQALEQDGDAIVDTLSGRKIKVVVRDDYLAINDQTNETPAMFWASLDEGGILKLGLFSKSADGEYYHPISMQINFLKQYGPDGQLESMVFKRVGPHLALIIKSSNKIYLSE